MASYEFCYDVHSWWFPSYSLKFRCNKVRYFDSFPIFECENILAYSPLQIVCEGYDMTG